MKKIYNFLLGILKKTETEKSIKAHEPLLRIVKRTDVKKSSKAIYYLCAILLSFAIASVMLIPLKVNPFEYIWDMVTVGIIGNRFPHKVIENLIIEAVPLLITSLALSLAFRIRFWNIGGEGQFIMGAIAAGTVAFLLGDKGIPTIVLISLMCTFAMLAGALYALIPTILKVKLGTNETLLTLMLNYIALYTIIYLGVTKADWNIFLRTDSVRPQFAFFPRDTWMGGIKLGDFTLSYAFLLTIIIFVIIYIYLNKTKKGYEIMVVGDSPNAARYAGMKVNKIVIRTVLLSASLIGLGGALYASSSHSLSESITGGVGWTGIIVAWLAKLNPVWIFITSILISVLSYGSKVSATQFTNIDANFANLLQGIILFLILIADFFIRFKIVIRSKDTEVA